MNELLTMNGKITEIFVVVLVGNHRNETKDGWISENKNKIFRAHREVHSFYYFILLRKRQMFWILLYIYSKKGIENVGMELL